MPLLGIILLALGVGAWLIGRRGDRVGAHPHCRNCDFDLYSLAPESRRCPECGNDILAEDAIVIGRYHANKLALVLGGLLACGGMALLAAAFLAWWPSFDGSSYMPLSWLKHQLVSADPPRRARACDEVRRRIIAGRFSRADTEDLARIVLRRQRDPAIAWDPRWGDLLQATRERGELSDSSWGEYLSQAMRISARARPRVRAGDPIPIAVSCSLRAGSDEEAIAPLWFSPQVTATLKGLVGTVQAAATEMNGVTIPVNWVMLWLPGDGDGYWTTPVVPGPHELRLDVILRVDDGRMRTSGRQDFVLPVEILPPNTSSVVQVLSAPGIKPTDLPAAWDHALRIRGPFNERGELQLGPGGQARVFVSGPPAGAAFHAVLRQGNREWSLARFLVASNDGATVPLALPATARPPARGAAEIVFLPDPELAIGTVDVMEVWGEPLRRPVILEGP